MKVLVGEFVTESNANIPTICTIKQYDIGLGEDCIQKMGIREVFERNDVTLIPSIYANAGAAGVVEKSAFTYIEHMFIDTLKKNLHEIDGIFLMLHGASEVEELGSGDHHILKELRKLAGPYLPIAIVCDPHGNLCKEYAESATILRSYRESPHTDADETMEKVAEMLCELLKKRRNIHAVYHKLPLILGGEQSVSADEPVLSINRYMNDPFTYYPTLSGTTLTVTPHIMDCWDTAEIKSLDKTKLVLECVGDDRNENWYTLDTYVRAE